MSTSVPPSSLSPSSSPVSSREHEALLLEVVRNDDPVRVLELISTGVNVNAALKSDPDDSKCTALQWAACLGHNGVVTVLLENGANVNDGNSFTDAALNFAAIAGHDVVLKTLIRHGASLDSRAAIRALHQAAQYGRDTAVQVLVEGDGVDINGVNRRGMTALHCAACNRHATVVTTLLARNANVEIQNKKEETPLHIASAQPEGTKGIVRALLEHGASVDAQSRDHETALLLAASVNNHGVVEVLLEYGANANGANKLGETALIRASRTGSTKVVDLLLRHPGTNVNLGTNLGDTALMLAAQYGREDILQMLLAHGASVYLKNKKGHTALQIVCLMDRQAIIYTLLHHHAGRLNHYSDFPADILGFGDAVATKRRRE